MRQKKKEDTNKCDYVQDTKNVLAQTDIDFFFNVRLDFASPIFGCTTKSCKVSMPLPLPLVVVSLHSG